jgi:ATP-binding cassette subfamily A (ABC1) protein 3
LQKVTNRTSASIAVTLVPVKSDEYVSDDFSLVLNGMLPFFLLLIYILPVYRLISNIVSEKESKARESMKMMGLSDFSYWLSWWTYYFVVVTIISILCLIVLSFNVFTNSNKGIIFLFLWIFGLSLFGMCILLQSFFSKARVAAITGTLVYFGTSFVNSAVADANVSQQAKNLASLLPTVAISRAAVNLGLFESNGQGLNSENIASVYQNYRFQDSLIIMTISLFITFWLGIYLDNVLPSAYGLRKPWYFCFTASYWFGADPDSRVRIHNRQSTSGLDMENADDYHFETKNMKRENFEPPSNDLRSQEKDNKILKIEDLKKVYDNGFQAVKGLNVKMYNGQIFALLGHNGAGKTTTISMLTGLVGASSGHCEVYGYDLFNDMSNVR